MHSKTKTIEKRLKKRADKTKAAIKIRNIIAHQPYPFAGEFREKKTTTEKEGQLINRMVSYIDDLAEFAAKTHIKDNFKTPKDYISAKKLNKDAHSNARKLVKRAPTDAEVKSEVDKILSSRPDYNTIDPNHLNDITLLSLSEFSLYPKEDQGALSLSGFHQLMEEIEQIAMNYPENLVLVLGTVPVKTNGSLNNLGIVVQCGPTPQLSSFRKATPSSIDPEYSDAKNLPFQNRYINIKKHDEIVAKANKIISKLSTNFALLTIKDLTGLESLFKDVPLHLKPKAEYFDKLANLKNELKKNKRYVHTSKATKEYTEVIALLRNHMDSEKKASEEKKELPHAILSDKNINVNIYSSRSIPIKTAGNSVLSLQPEICLDHSAEVTKNSLLQDYQLARSNADVMLPSNAIHVIVSDSVTLNADHLVSDTVAHADTDVAEQPGVRTAKGKIKSISSSTMTSSFGPGTMLETYPVVDVSQHINKYQKNIDTYNAFLIKLDSLRHYREQHLSDIKLINKDISTHITQDLVSLLQSSPKSFQGWIDLFNKPTEDISRTIAALKDLKKSSELKKTKTKQRGKIRVELNRAIRLLEMEARTTARLENLQSTIMQPTADLPVMTSSTSAFFKPPEAQRVTHQGKYLAHTTSESEQPTSSIEETLMVSRLLQHFSPFTLPWNKITTLNEGETTQLKEHLAELKSLEQKLDAPKPLYYLQTEAAKEREQDVRVLIEHAKNDIKGMLDEKKKTSAKWSAVKTNIDRISTSLSPPDAHKKKQTNRHR